MESIIQKLSFKSAFNKYFTIFSLIIIATSCSNDSAENEPVKSIYLTDYKFSFFANPLGLQYDANNKLISFETLDPTSSTLTKINNTINKDANGKVTKVGNSTFTYNASNLITQIDNGTGNGITQLTYDSQGRLMTQTTSYFGGTVNETKNLTYDSSNRIAELIIHAYNSSTLNTYYKYVFIYDAKSNISNASISTSTNGTTYTSASTVNYTYDDKPNPLKSITNNIGFSNYFISPSLQFDFFSTEQFGYIAAYNLCFISNNNITYKQVVYTAGGGNNTSYTYTYDALGYPSKVVINDDEDGTSTTNFNYILK